MSLDLDLKGQHALVCGASAGIGRATAFALAGLGAQVTVLSRRREALEALCAELPAGNGQHHALIAVDVGDGEALSREVARRVGESPVTILVHNSGGPPGGAASEAEPSAYLRAFEQHLLAGQRLLQAVLPGMRAAGYGRLVNIISTSVREPIAGLGVSNTVRGAVASWAKTLASELAADGITVNNVLPGFTRTGRLDALIASRAEASGNSPEQIAAGMLAGVPAGRFAEASEIAAAVAFLASPAAAYINGVSLAVDGGRTRCI